MPNTRITALFFYSLTDRLAQKANTRQSLFVILATCGAAHWPQLGSENVIRHHIHDVPSRRIMPYF